MSLMSFAIRFCIAEALKGNTWAGDRVRDSQVEPLDELFGEKRELKPLIAIYSGTLDYNPVGSELTGARKRNEVTVQIYIPPEIKIERGDESITLKERGIAFALDITERQVEAALVVPDNVWAVLWRRFVPSYDRVLSRPVLLQVEDGTRCVCREISYLCKPLLDPPWGKPLQGIWIDFYNALKASASADNLAIAEIVKESIEKPSGLADWQLARIAMGVTDGVMQNIGEKTLVDPAPPIEEITLDYKPEL